jgi:3-methyl-2-oxobutanoate hydroxymethyltransferase
VSTAVPLDRDRPVTTATLRAMKPAHRPIAMVTAYDASSARLAEAAGVDAILVGDSLGMVVLGYDSTLPVTMDDMVRATAAVTRVTRRVLVVADMPFMSFQVGPEEALRNAGRLMAEAGARAVKLEGGVEIAPTVARIQAAGIPVMGHIGLTPQSVHELGGYKVQARETASALKLLEDAYALEEAGCFAVVLECIPAELAAIVTDELAIPTVGIGAGAGCDGQVQVFHDLLGLGGDFKPRHARRYADAGAVVREALAAYVGDVRDGSMAGEETCTHADVRVLAEVEAARKRAQAARRPGKA